MNVRIVLVLVGGLLGLSQVAEAQLTQIRRDYQQPMTYSPDDPFTKGLVYRLQTGQAGKYFNCDCEEEKRYSPYIYWQTVCNHTHPVPYCRVLLRDLHEVKERVRAGACRGGQNCQCQDCQSRNSGYYLAAQAGADSATAQATEQVAGSEMVAPATVPPVAAATVTEESQHVVYGSRTTRQRMAQQGSFGEQPAANGLRTAERDSPQLQPQGMMPRR
jgi:hypothetical protein